MCCLPVYFSFAGAPSTPSTTSAGTNPSVVAPMAPLKVFLSPGQPMLPGQVMNVPSSASASQSGPGDAPTQVAYLPLPVPTATGRSHPNPAPIMQPSLAPQFFREAVRAPSASSIPGSMMPVTHSSAMPPMLSMQQHVIYPVISQSGVPQPYLPVSQGSYVIMTPSSQALSYPQYFRGPGGSH